MEEQFDCIAGLGSIDQLIGSNIRLLRDEYVGLTQAMGMIRQRLVHCDELEKQIADEAAKKKHKAKLARKRVHRAAE